MLAPEIGPRLSAPPATGRCVATLDPGDWTEWVAQASQPEFLQTAEWGALKAEYGWEPVRLAVARRGQIVGGAQVLFRRLPLGVFGYVPRGPLVDWSDRAATACLLSGLDELARARGAVFLKVEPPRPADAVMLATLAGRGYRRSRTVQPRTTLVVDLSDGPAAAWARLSPGVRYNVRLATRRGVVVTECGEAGLPTFYDLLRSTATRAGFPVHEPEYYSAAWKHLNGRGLARLAIASYEGEPLAAALTLVLGRRAYHLYAGSSFERRNLKPNDLLQWETIRRAQAEGCLAYDLWGIPDEVGRAAESGDAPRESAGDALWGVYRFKRGFGGEVVRFAGAFDRVYSPRRYWLWCNLQPELGWLKHLLGRHRGAHHDRLDETSTP